MRRMKLPIRRPWIPYIILVISLLITVLATIYVTRATEDLDRLRFESAVQQTQNSIDNRIETYVALLRGGAGLMATTDTISADEFRLFVERLRLQERYPGIQGIGYAERVRADDKETYIESARETISNFTIRPDGDRQEYYPIKYLEPLNFKNNENAIGYDMFSEKVRRKAMERARDTGTRAASGKVTLIQEDGEKNQAAFLIYIPVYQGSKIPVTVSEKRETIRGFIYAPFRADDLLTGIIGNESQLLVSFKIYDGTKVTQETLLHDSTTITKKPPITFVPRFHETRQINVAGETWTLEFANDPQFELLSQRGLAPVILIGGLVISIVVFLLSRSQFIARTVAEQSASKLRYSQKELQKAIGMRDNFISIASHELKTPVTSLKVYTEVLLRTFTAKGDKKHTEYMEKMNRQIDKLTILIQDLLDVSRLQAGRLAFREEEFSLNDVVHEIVENTNPIADDHTIIVKGKTKRTVWGDKDRVGQVLSNFLTNAIKYSPKAKKVLVTLKEEGDHAKVSVQDYGIGIDAKHLNKIFNRFYRVADTNEQTFPGLGMGLYICSEIIKRHGGEITVESVKGKGSIFSFTLPYYQPSKAA